MKDKKATIEYRCPECNNSINIPGSNTKQIINSNFIIARKVCDYCGLNVSFKIYKSK